MFDVCNFDILILAGSSNPLKFNKNGIAKILTWITICHSQHVWNELEMADGKDLREFFSWDGTAPVSSKKVHF